MTRASKRTTSIGAGSVVVALVAAGAAGFLVKDGGGGESGERPRTLSIETNDPIARACALDDRILERIALGNDPDHAQDVIVVPWEPNYVGEFDYTSHTGPWDYVQEVPLVLYGPGVIAPSGEVERPVTLADVYPTAGALSGVTLPNRAGEPLREALGADRSSPRLIVTVVWDGVGRNVLERWPGRTPVLERMASEGTSYVEATVGSSPSITPATHSTLGTGEFPLVHGVPAIKFRTDDGRVREAFDYIRPHDLEVTTYGDDIDSMLGGRPRVGMVAWQPWHLGMLGHGAQIAGADKDQLALITGKTEGKTISTNERFYELPVALEGAPGLAERIEALDRGDGEADGTWQGIDITEQKNNPAWVQHESDLLIQLLESGGYGDDEVPDLAFANFKATDLMAHQRTMDDPAMGDVVEAQDAALGALIEYLDREVGNYALIVTADHGSTPRPERSGAWAISTKETTADLDSHFGIPDGESLVESFPAHGIFVDEEVARENGVSLEAIALFLNGYTIGANTNSETQPPARFTGREGERVFEAAFPRDVLGLLQTCGEFGSNEG